MIIWVNCPCFTFLFKVVYYFGLFTLLLAYFLGNNPEGDLGVFFKEVQGDLNFTFFFNHRNILITRVLSLLFFCFKAAPQLKATVLDKCNDMTDASLEAQLTSLCDDLSLYENKSEEYEELLATLQTTATTTSESESEAS